MPRSDRQRSRASLRDVAEAAGVSISTVSRALAEHPDVSSDARARVTTAAEQLGYRPNALGQMLRRGTTQAIGFSVADITNPVLARVVLGASEVLSKAGYSVILTNSMQGPEEQRAALGNLIARSVDGVIVSLIDERDEQTIKLLSSFDGPVVAIDRDLSRVPRADAVWSNHEAGIEEAVAALSDAGHRSVALISGAVEIRPGRERSRAFRSATEQRGLEATDIVVDVNDPATVASAISALMAAKSRPTALICGNNVLLPPVLESLRKAGVIVPRDMSLVTCDVVPLQRALLPTLSTISRDELEVGRVAASLLLDRLRSPDSPAVVRLLDVAFEPSESIAAPPVSGPRV